MTSTTCVTHLMIYAPPVAVTDGALLALTGIATTQSTDLMTARSIGVRTAADQVGLKTAEAAGMVCGNCIGTGLSPLNEPD